MVKMMSTSPYSMDLREKVIKFLESENTQVSAAKTFSLNLSTVKEWHSRYKKEGNYAPRKRLGKKSRLDKEIFGKYISENPNVKLYDLSKKFGLSISGIHYWLTKLRFSYKKKALAMRRLVKKNERNI